MENFDSPILARVKEAAAPVKKALQSFASGCDRYPFEFDLRMFERFEPIIRTITHSNGSGTFVQRKRAASLLFEIDTILDRLREDNSAGLVQMLAQKCEHVNIAIG